MNSKVAGEEEKIRETIMRYVNGVVEFDFNKAESGWHPDGVKISYSNEDDTLIFDNILDTRPNLRAEDILRIKSEISHEWWIESVEFYKSVAAVKLVWTSEREGIKQVYTDFILLLQIQGNWKIVAKVSHQQTI